MAIDHTYVGTASERTGLTRYISGFNITETGASTAYVKFRDAMPQPSSALSAVDGAAGNVTTGLHMLCMTVVTRHGETVQGGTGTEYTSAGSKIATTTIPLATEGLDVIVGRRLYVTKAGAPTTGVIPTNAQWFLVVADASSTLASNHNGLTLAGTTTITVASGTAFATAGRALVTTTTGIQPIAYTGKSTNDLTGVTMLRPAYTGGLMATGGAVTQPMIPNNTATSYNWNVVDGSLAAVQPPLKDTSGQRLKTIKLGSGESMGDDLGPNVLALGNGGGLYVEVNSGTVEWTVTGQ